MKEKIFLSGLIEGFNVIKSEAKHKFLNITNEKLNFKPAPGKWSAAECLVHLITTDNLYSEIIKKALQNSTKDEFHVENIKHTFAGKIILGFFKPESKLKMKTFKEFTPAQSNFDSSIVEKFIQQKDDMIALIEEAKLYHASKIKITSPALKLLKLNLPEMLMFLYIHDKRHIIQADKAVKLYKNN